MRKPSNGKTDFKKKLTYGLTGLFGVAILGIGWFAFKESVIGILASVTVAFNASMFSLSVADLRTGNSRAGRAKALLWVGIAFDALAIGLVILGVVKDSISLWGWFGLALAAISTICMYFSSLISSLEAGDKPSFTLDLSSSSPSPNGSGGHYGYGVADEPQGAYQPVGAPWASDARHDDSSSGNGSGRSTSKRRKNRPR